MYLLTLFSLFLISCLGCSNGKPWEPLAKKGAWMKKHESLLKITETLRDRIKVVFIGASITEYWQMEGKEIWNSYYERIGAANYGIGGDTTSNVLWRIQNKELDGLDPKIIVFSCGPGYNSMNKSPAPTGAETLLGLKEIFKELRNKFTKSKLIIIGHTPYDRRPEINTASKHNNIEMKKFADDKDVFFIDLSSQLTNSEGKQLRNMFKVDQLHLSSAGYSVWHKNIRQLIEEIMK